MRRLLLAVLVLVPLTAHAADPRTVAAAMRDAAREIDAGRVPALPGAWLVETPSRQYTIDAAPARDLLTPPHTSLRHEQARHWLNTAAAQLEAYTLPPPPAAAKARDALNRILAQPVFSGLRPPNAWELLKRRFTTWIQELLASLFQIAGQHPTTGYVLFWLLVAVAVGVLVTWLIRMWRRDAVLDSIAPGEQALPARTWREWVKAARTAADGGNARLAVHCAYWAGVTYLEESGALPVARAATPREVLRLARASSAEKPLASLTGQLERHWYGGRAAGAGDVDQSLKNLEALGCRLD